MAERKRDVRVLLSGCAHKPKFLGIAMPVVGDVITCHACRTGRKVVGHETGWSRAHARCYQCKWSIISNGMTKKKMLHLSQIHASARDHRVEVVHDAQARIIKPATSFQPFLVDDLLLP